MSETEPRMNSKNAIIMVLDGSPLFQGIGNLNLEDFSSSIEYLIIKAWNMKISIDLGFVNLPCTIKEIHVQYFNYNETVILRENTNIIYDCKIITEKANISDSNCKIITKYFSIPKYLPYSCKDYFIKEIYFIKELNPIMPCNINILSPYVEMDRISKITFLNNIKI